MFSQELTDRRLSIWNVYNVIRTAHNRNGEGYEIS